MFTDTNSIRVRVFFDKCLDLSIYFYVTGTRAAEDWKCSELDQNYSDRVQGAIVVLTYRCSCYLELSLSP